MKNLKMYILEALLKQNSTTKKDTYIKIDVDGQKTQTTTSIFSKHILMQPTQRILSGIRPLTSLSRKDTQAKSKSVFAKKTTREWNMSSALLSSTLKK